MQYFDDILRVCGIAVLCVVVLMVLSRLGSLGAGSAVRIGGAVLIFGIFIMILRDNLETLEGVVSSVSRDSSYISRAFGLMLKALGIALLCKLCSDICRDCGESTLATGVEGVGRAAIFSLCLPIISEIIEYASKVLSM